MKQILLDTNFLISCAKQKIDLFEFLEEEGFEILIPASVLAELENIASRKKGKDNLSAALALKILEKNNFTPIEIKGKTVDKSIINYVRENPGLTIATLDRDIQKRIKNKKLIIRGKKKLEKT